MSEYSATPRVIGPGETYDSITDHLNEIVESTRPPLLWWGVLGVSSMLLLVLMNAVGYLFYKGVGIWGVNIPIGWGFAIINFVWWIGIGHAGTLISAILLLFRQDWRTSINRFSEAMTLFAVSCAGLFPLLHTGRPWAVFFMLPYPSTLAMWPQWRSPLMWDVFAVSTYGTVSAIFWYVGLIPDLATLRDHARSYAARVIYGIMSMGWRGSARHWFRYENAYVLLAGLAAPLVVSVHSIVSLDFSVGIVPGWHTTIFPPYFVAGAIYSGFAMVLTLMLPARKIYRLENYVTMRHIDNMCKVMLATGLVVAYGYLMEVFFSWYSGVEYERYMMFENRWGGPKAIYYWMLILCNILIPQLLWFKRFRTNIAVVFALSIVINIGMWLERYVIVVMSLERDFLPSSWDQYSPTVWDWATYLGTLGQFAFLMMLFIKFLPMINAFEMKHLLHALHTRKERMHNAVKG